MLIKIGSDRMDNKRWVFFQLPKVPIISGDEARYWKNTLRKIIKVGLEFEFNLPNNEGTCKGTSLTCPCIHFKGNDCWKKCNLEEECRKAFGEEFEAKCAKEFCTNFSMFCSQCKDFKLDCEECTYRYDKDKDPDNVRNHLRNQMTPSESYGHMSESGVHSIVCDGSLLGSGAEGKGAEVITNGRRVDYWEFYKMIKGLMDKSMEKGAYVNERCSIHAHILATYYKSPAAHLSDGQDSSSELERPLPSIVLSNFHQLCRKYQNAITWMCMGLDDPKAMTRWEKFRVSVLDSSPVTTSMQDVIQDMEEKSGKKRGKYGWVNYMFMQFNSNNDVTRFHLEIRPMDGLLSASAVTALSCLFYAMILKAVEISKYGLLEVGSEEWVARSRSVKNRLMNGTGSWEGKRLSDTSRLSIEDKDFLIMESLDLISQVKHVLHQLGPAYEVLEKLAYEPCAVRRCKGKDWLEIESELEVHIKEETKVEKDLTELIDLRVITGCEDEEQWVIKVTDLLSETHPKNSLDDMVKTILHHGKNDGEIIWSDRLGSMLIV
jgi:hypothetical protein